MADVRKQAPTTAAWARDRLAREARWLRSVAVTIGLLQEVGIPTLVLKGPALSMWLYGNPLRRPRGDLDLLVPEALHARAVAILEAHGFVAKDEFGGVARCRAVFGNADTLVDGAGLHLDLHWRLFPEHALQRDAQPNVWASTLTIELAGRTCLTVGPPVLLEYLLVHGGLSQYTQQKWLDDVVACLAKTDATDLEAQLQAARAKGTWRLQAVGLWLAHETAGAPLPRPLRDRLANDRVVQRISRRLKAANEMPRAADATSPKAFLVGLQLLDRRRARIRHAWIACTNPTKADVAALRLPPWAAPAYRLLRPVRLLGLAAKTALGLRAR